MEEADEKFSTYNSNTSSDSNSIHSLIDKNALEKSRNETSKKLDEFISISSSISSQFNKIIENYDTIGTTELCTKYLSAPKRLKNEHEASMKYHVEEIKMKKEIRELERKLNSCLSRNQIISQEVSALQKKKATTQEALCLAKKYYSSVWDMNINIEDSKEDRFTCIINFKFDCGMYPIKFVIDRKNREILDWDGSSLLTTEEENEMKERYSENPDFYFPQVLSELRLLALNKIKMS